MKIFTKTTLKGAITFALISGAAGFGAYSLTPNRVRQATPTETSTEEANEPVYFNKLMGKITSSGSLDDEPLGLSAEIDDFVVAFPNKDASGNNIIAVNGSLNLLMRSLNDFDVSIDADIDYNGRDVDLALGLVGKDFYLAVDDLCIKSSFSCTEDFLGYILYDSILNKPIEEGGLGLDFDFEKVIQDFASGIDVTSLLSGLADPTALKINEKVIGDEVSITVSISDNDIGILVDKESLAIKNVDLGELVFGNVSIKGKLNCDVIDNVMKLDDPLYPKQREFIEVISYINWVDKALEFFKNKTVGLELQADVNLLGDGSSVPLLQLDSSINLDLTDVIDIYSLDVMSLINGESSTDADSLVGDAKKMAFDFGASIKGQGNEEYSNLSLTYAEEASYLNLNQAAESSVLKAKLDNDSLSRLLEMVPSLSSGIASLVANSKIAGTLEDTTESLFDFVTSSELVSAIKKGDYSAILDVIKTLRNDGSRIYLDLSLSSLGLGKDSLVSLILDSSKEAGVNLLSLTISGVEAMGLGIDISLKDKQFDGARIAEVLSNKDEYDDLSFVPGIIAQASEICASPKAKLFISGSVKDENNEGVDISGTAQFDANENVGYGNINIREFNSKVVNSNKYIDHRIEFDVNNNDESLSNNNLYLVYNENLKAKLTLQTFSDMISLVSELLGSDDERFTKFIDPLMESFISAELSNIIESQDYLSFAKSSVLKSVKQISGGDAIEVIIGGGLLKLEEDIVLRINLATKNNEKRLESIEVVNLLIKGTRIQLKASLLDFDDSFNSKINKADNFMDFSQVRVLLDFGINTTKLNYYHLTADAKLNISVLMPITVKLDFHIYVDGKTTKVYGSIDDVPWLSDILSSDIATTKIGSEFVFEPTEDIGGVFHIVKNRDRWLGKDEVVYYKASSKCFLENIVSYLAVDMLNLRASEIENLSSSTISSEKNYDPDYSKLFTDDGFAYSKNEQTGINTWNIGINMNEILCNDSLGALQVELHGKDDGNSGLFTDADVSMTIASILKVTAKVSLVDPDFNVKSWPSEINAKYSKAIGWYDSLSSAAKADFDANYFNQPLKGYTMVSKRGYF